MKQRRKIQFKQWLILAAAWQFMALWICVYDHLVIHSGLSSSPAKDYSFITNLSLYSSVTFIATLIGGSILVFYINPKFINKSYSRSIAAVIATIVLVMSIITLITAYLYVTLLLKIPVKNAGFSKAFWNYALDALNVKDTLIWSTITALTQFVFQMTNKFGPGVLWKIITGKYRIPKTEEKIFMFLDLNSSTSIAENLSEVNYHRFLKDFFAHITNAIVSNSGEIYQYVGDEIVIAWSIEKGIRDNHCIQSFFDMKKEIENKRDYYYSVYGFVPSFKAGIHSGHVIAGEVGIFKRDITFSGDVLNTAARIRSLCKQFGAEFIASSELLNHLHSTDPFSIRELGSVALRGKKEKVELNSLSMAA